MTRVVFGKRESSLDPVEVYRQARHEFRPTGSRPWVCESPEAEGGCGVTGFACTVPVRGKHIYEPSIQMRNSSCPLLEHANNLCSPP